ncbi:MAG: hypothetical protein GY750_21035 [Lentisphaerae bacterium]|nr:hypothetical protein [Lentisphaerota bacterium]
MVLVQGDQSKIIKISLTDYPDISDANWIGEYTIRDRNVKGEILQQETLGKEIAGDKFVFFITAENSAILDVGTTFLAIEIRNMTITPSFRQEVVRELLTISDSGVPNV